MIVVTGGAGFIGSAIVWRLNQLGRTDIYVVDELGCDDKWKNLVGLNFVDFINKKEFIEKWNGTLSMMNVDEVIHMGANSSTTEKDADLLMENNYKYTLELARSCLQEGIRFVYASSAATYGDGLLGFKDDEDGLNGLRPLNMYGYSKALFDKSALREGWLKKIAGIKFFNVYGPNEYHKGDMRSVVHKAFGQIIERGEVNLFKSKNPSYKDGEQLRDFVYVKDAVDMTLFLLENKKCNGIFNVGTGKARSWNDLVTSLFNSIGKPVKINYIDLPVNLEKKYQYFTQAEMSKIRDAGYTKEITSLENGIDDYVKNYLLKEEYLRN